ncbi:MAG: hypothetical protein PHR25_02590 [Clostridia bacterium]|nr:hypothetical protein [Clostridia bacterium]MDD4375647.1 hypothetical protein [Clostridia bacterium]
MFVYNIKLNMKRILIGIGVLVVAVALFMELGPHKNKENSKVNVYSNKFDYNITDANFTNMLKKIHDDIDKNIGKTVSISGFVFTMPDFKDSYFVCGRNMILSGNEKVVGFLCNYKKADKLLESEWVQITGVIEKGFYQTDMPIIKVKTIKKITAPENTFVNPPTSNY